MAVFVLYVRRLDDWVEASRFEASSTADALKKAKHAIPPDYGNGPIKLIEQPGAEHPGPHLGSGREH
jgi:hypothetical protein